jgi:hypothetical protein
MYRLPLKEIPNKRQSHIMPEEKQKQVELRGEHNQFVFDRHITHTSAHILNFDGTMIMLGFNTTMDGITINQPNGKSSGM